MNFNFPKINEIVENKDAGYFIVVTSMNLTTEEGTFKLFQTFEEAYEWIYPEEVK